MKKVKAQKQQATTFYLKSLQLQDFRGLRDIEIDFDKDLTVFIGTNGAGKTTILDAIAGSFQVIEAIIRNRSGKYLPETVFKNSDIYNEVNFARVNITSIIQYDTADTSFQETGSEDTKTVDIHWSHELSREGFKYIPENLDQIERFSEGIQHRLREEMEVSLPILVHYQLQKAANAFGLNDATTESSQPNILSIFNAYDGALDQGRFNYQSFFRWFRQQFGQAIQSRNGGGTWKVVTQAIYDFFAVVEEPKYLSDLAIDWSLATEGELVVKKKGVQIQLGQLSSGEKSLMLLVADLARRLCMANPNAQKPMEGYGVALIDEIEIHLHPKWQKNVIKGLRETFPNVQFIMTSHSPLVLQGIRSEHISILDEGKIYAAEPTQGQSYETILKSSMDTTALPYQDKLNDLFMSIENDKIAEAKQLIVDIQKIVEGPLPILDRAKGMIRRKELLKA